MITVELLRSWGACWDDQRISSLVPPDGLTPIQVYDLKRVEVEDKLWVLLHVIPDLSPILAKWLTAVKSPYGFSIYWSQVVDLENLWLKVRNESRTAWSALKTPENVKEAQTLAAAASAINAVRLARLGEVRAASAAVTSARDYFSRLGYGPKDQLADVRLALEPDSTQHPELEGAP